MLSHPNSNMRALPQLSTPLLRLAVQKLTKPESHISKAIATADRYVLGNRIAKTIVATDQKINSHQSLRFIFSTDLEAEFNRIRPFLNEQLIQETMKLSLERERRNAKLPKPGENWMEQAAIDDSLKKHKKKIAVLIKEDSFFEAIWKEFLNELECR